MSSSQEMEERRMTSIKINVVVMRTAQALAMLRGVTFSQLIEELLRREVNSSSELRQYREINK